MAQSLTRAMFFKVVLGSASVALMGGCGARGTLGSLEREGDATASNLGFMWWGGSSRNAYTQRMVELYAKKHADVEFRTLPSEWEGYFDKLAVDAATGSMYDIVQMDYLYISTFAKNGSLAGLDAWVKQGIIDLTTVEEELLQTGVIDGRLVGVPVSQTGLAFFYEPSLLANAGVEEPAAGWSWDDFRAACLAVHDKLGKWGCATSPVLDVNLLNYWVRQYGAALFAEDGRSLGYGDDGIVEAYLAFWSELIARGAAPGPDVYERISAAGSDAAPILSGEAAFHQSWDNYATIAASLARRSLQVAVPPVSDPSARPLWRKPGMFLSIAEISPHQRQCAEFIDWFLNGRESNEVMLGERGVPASATARDRLLGSGKLSAPQEEMFSYLDAAESLCGQTPGPDPLGIDDVNIVFKDISYQVFYGEMTPAKAARIFHERADAVLQASK